MVDKNAMLSPQPGLPRKQIPYTPFFGSWILAAASRTCTQVGRSENLIPALSVKSLRYMSMELSP